MYYIYIALYITFTLCIHLHYCIHSFIITYLFICIIYANSDCYPDFYAGFTNDYGVPVKESYAVSVLQVCSKCAAKH